MLRAFLNIHDREQEDGRPEAKNWHGSITLGRIMIEKARSEGQGGGKINRQRHLSFIINR